MNDTNHQVAPETSQKWGMNLLSDQPRLFNTVSQLNRFCTLPKEAAQAAYVTITKLLVFFQENSATTRDEKIVELRAAVISALSYLLETRQLDELPQVAHDVLRADYQLTYDVVAESLRTYRLWPHGLLEMEEAPHSASRSWIELVHAAAARDAILIVPEEIRQDPNQTLRVREKQPDEATARDIILKRLTKLIVRAKLRQTTLEKQRTQ